METVYMQTTSLFTQQRDNSRPSSRRMEIQRIAPWDEVLHPNHHLPVAGHFRILWIIRGKGNCRIDLEQFTFVSNSAFFVKPGQVLEVSHHSIESGYLLSFAGTLLGIDDDNADCVYPDGLLRFFAIQFCQLVPEAEEDIQDTIEKMIRELMHPDLLFTNEVIKRYFKILMIYVSRQYEQDMETVFQIRDLDLVKRFLSMVDIDYQHFKLVSDYAGKLSLTSNYITQVIKRITGYPAGYHIRQRVALEAKRQAIYSPKSMKEISYLLGFSDTCHFSKFFKKITGMTFVDFRRKRSVVLCVPESNQVSRA